jgi:hypothetical protein
MRKGIYPEMVRRAWTFTLVGVLLCGALAFSAPVVNAHSGDVIYSVQTTTPPIIDGSFSIGEWSDAAVVDLSAVAGNDLGSYLYAANNDTHVFLSYDAYGDLTDDVGDAASVSFDSGHDGIPTDGVDDQFAITGDGTTVHYAYDVGTVSWQVHCSPFDIGLTNHTGLTGAGGFGVSPNSGTDHRIYEFSIPLSLLNVSVGDTIGFFAGSEQVPGVTETGFTRWDTWPSHGILALFEYGNLVLGTQEGVSLTPGDQSQPADVGTVATYALTVNNTGLVADIFDITSSSTMGWATAFFDGGWNPLIDTGGSPDVDTGPVPSRSSVDIYANLTVPGGANPSDFDVTTVIATSSNNASVSSTAMLRTGVPVLPIWTDFMEGGPDGWYVPAGANDWEHGIPNWAWGPANASSPVNVWGTNLTGNYSFSSDSILVSPFIDLTNAVDSNMTFYHWYDINGVSNDGGWVEISIDNGESWGTAVPDAGYTDFTSLNRECYAGSDRYWAPAEFNLTSYVGNYILLAFHMWDNSGDGTQKAGWYIDNVTVNATFLSAGVRVTPESQFKPGMASTTVTYGLTVENIGTSGPDIFDITSISSLGWTASFYDSGWNPLTNTGGGPEIDTGTIAFGSSLDIFANITVPGVVSPGDVDVTDVTFVSVNDPVADDTATLITQIPLIMPFFDDMESGTNGWISDGFWHQVYNETAAPPWNISYSPAYSWWYGQDAVGHYDNGARNWGSLTSPPVDLTAAPSAELEFAYYYQTELTADRRSIEIRLGDGPWQVLELLSGDPMNSWILKTVDLSSYLGNIVQIRFFFDTVDSLNNQFQGWYIDDVSLAGIKQRPTVEAWEPGGSPAQLYTIGVMIPVTWTATDDKPMPADNVNITYGSGGSWTEINGGLYNHANDGMEIWDTTGASPGIYYMNISAYDSDGLTTYDFSNNTFDLVLPDMLAPEIEYVHINGVPVATVAPNDPVTLTAKINDTFTGGSIIDAAEWSYTCGPWPGNLMWPQDGSWDEVAEIANDSFNAPAIVGTYTVYVRARDASATWNESCLVYGMMNVSLGDVWPPDIFSPLVNGQAQIRITPGTPVLLTATIDDTNSITSNVSSAQYMVNPPSAPIDMDPTDGAFDQPVEDVEANVDTTGLGDDTYDLCIYASDDWAPPNLNNSGTACAVIIIDGTPPDILNANIPASVVNGTTATITATIDDMATGGSSVKSANFTYGTFNWPGTSMNPVVPPFDSQTEDVTFDIQTGVFPYWVGTNHMVCIYASDILDNNNTVGPCVTFEVTGVDDQAPEVSNVQADVASFKVGSRTTINVTATVDDTNTPSTGPSPIASANFTIGAENWAGTTMEADDGSFDDVTELVKAEINVSTWNEGTYQIFVYGSDASGNDNITSTANVTIDVTPVDTTSPVIVNEVIDPTDLEPDEEVTISANVTDDITPHDDLVVEVIITFPDGQDHTYDMTFNADTGNFEYKSTFSTEGDFAVIINATDESGNYRASEIPGGFTVTEAPPPTVDEIPLWVWLLIIILIIVVIVILAMVASRRRREEADQPDEEVEEEEPEGDVEPEEEIIGEEDFEPEEELPSEEVALEETVEETPPAEHAPVEHDVGPPGI